MVNNPCANAENVGSLPESGRSSGEGYGNPLQYSFLGNPIDRAVSLLGHRVRHNLVTKQ